MWVTISLIYSTVSRRSLSTCSFISSNLILFTQGVNNPGGYSDILLNCLISFLKMS